MDFIRLLSGGAATSSYSVVNCDSRAFASKPFTSCSHRRGSECRAAPAQLSLFSPSKVNLFLRVMRKREDGYHDLASLFHVIDLGDDLEFEVLPWAGADELTCNMEDVPTDNSNLVVKALNLFRHKTGIDQFMRVHLHKQVPAGAGLGGGSGNAATTLWAANEMSGRPASNSDLLLWAGEIGSDISVFFSEGAAYCTGRGEVVENVIPPLPLEMPLLLVKPHIGCSTPQIFKALRLDECSSADPLDLMQRMGTDHSQLAEICINDLEQPAFRTLEELRTLKQRLQEDSNGRFCAVFMTGSGSTMVCIGSVDPPEFLKDAQYAHTFVRPAHLIARNAGQWYRRSSVAEAALA